MTVVFADTFCWIALTLPTEGYHHAARDFDARFGRSGRILTTEEVLTEYLNFFSTQGTYWRAHAIAVVQRLRRKTYLEILPQTSESFRRGFELYAARPDKRYSLTDCISMQIMRCAGITDVLTHDRHFEQEGFRALFR